MAHEHARPDYGRHHRQGFPEAVYCAAKSEAQILHIAGNYRERRQGVLFTRLDAKTAARLRKLLGRDFRFEAVARMGLYEPERRRLAASDGRVLVATAGTSDVPVAEEAALTAEHILGRAVSRVFDVGVAGLHRILERGEEVQRARVVVVCAGMDGALPSVVGGLASCPVIAVPTSVGYGVAAGGQAALGAMLASCASNVCVVNIDNGFSAGVIASLIAKQSS